MAMKSICRKCSKGTTFSLKTLNKGKAMCTHYGSQQSKRNCEFFASRK